MADDRVNYLLTYLLTVWDTCVQVPSVLEVCLVPRTSAASQYPGIYLFTTVARLMRPVWNYTCKSVEMIGTFEQVYLNVAITDADAQQSVCSRVLIAETITSSSVYCDVVLLITI